MGQDRLNNFNLMNIECINNLLKEIDLSSVINKFAYIKSRKVYLLKWCFILLSYKSLGPRGSIWYGPRAGLIRHLYP